jgi:hypothetical protein
LTVGTLASLLLVKRADLLHAEHQPPDAGA